VSGFLLCWHREGGAFSEAIAARAGALLAHRGPEGLTRREGPGVLALHAAFTVAPGAEDGLPLAVGDWMLTGDIRLDARQALRDRLRDRVPSVDDADDALLLVHALNAWGAAATSRLMGDFAFAAVDVSTGHMVAARGTTGVKGLFVAEGRGFVAASNDLDVLLALPGVDGSPAERAIVQYLRDGQVGDAMLTARRGVSRVPAGWQCAWSRQGAARRERHWRLPVPARLRFWREEEYGAQFHEVLEDAISDRLRAPRAGIMLSGGLDSSAIAVSARICAPGVDLRGLTVSNERVTPDDEHRWAARVAAHLGIPLLTEFTEADAPLAHCRDRTVRTPEPASEFELLAWRARAARLATFGPVALYGEDGDALLAPPDLLTMLRTLPFLETLRAWATHHVEYHEHPWTGLRERAHRIRRPRAMDDDTPIGPSWLRRDARDADLGDGRLGVDPHPLRPQAAARLSAPDWESFFVENDAAITGVPTSIVLPLLDARVIAFVFAIPPIPWTQRKALLRRAYRGRLPDEVLRRPKTPVAGYHEAAVRRWRAVGGATWTLPSPMAQWVDEREWRRTLREGPVERVMEAWRVFEVARWLAQPEAAAR
jgi:asparagine synthase (glutamine-hydrolysing)